MSRDIHVTVAAIVRRDDCYLIVEETVGGRLVLNQPAGHLEPRETIIEAAVRETLEETAWDFVPQALVGIYQYESAEGITYLRFAFAGEVTGHHPERRLDRGIERALWLTRAQLVARAADHRGPQVLRAIDDYESGCCYPLNTLVGWP
ncbi:MAG: NUDIX hydrolase [Acidiferrobacter sp.]